MTDEEFQREVERLATSPAVARIFEALLNKQAEAWLQTSMEQVEHREKMHAYVMAIQGLRSSLSAIANDPKVLEWNRRLANKQDVR